MKQLMVAFCLALLVLVQPASGRTSNSLKHLVDIGNGRRLNMVCTGKGSPTVVFLQGLGGDITNWRKVREPVSAVTQACFYDRAGLGYSDPTNKPSTAENVADDLHALLRAAGIKGRVVLVGHSLGGLFATLYADKFLADVAGLVLVDPSFDGEFDYVLSEGDKKANLHDGDQWVSMMKACTKLAQESKVSQNDSHNCFQLASGMTPEETDYVTQQFYRPSYYASMLSEFVNFSPEEGTTLDGDQERHLKRPFGNLPFEVLSASIPFFKLSKAGIKTVADVWRRGHDRLAQRSTRGESILIANSHHFIQLDQPDRVVLAIRKVVLEARQ